MKDVIMMSEVELNVKIIIAIMDYLDAVAQKTADQLESTDNIIFVDFKHKRTIAVEKKEVSNG